MNWPEVGTITIAFKLANRNGYLDANIAVPTLPKPSRVSEEVQFIPHHFITELIKKDDSDEPAAANGIATPCAAPLTCANDGEKGRYAYSGQAIGVRVTARALGGRRPKIMMSSIRVCWRPCCSKASMRPRARFPFRRVLLMAAAASPMAARRKPPSPAWRPRNSPSASPEPWSPTVSGQGRRAGDGGAHRRAAARQQHISPAAPSQLKLGIDTERGTDDCAVGAMAGRPRLWLRVAARPAGRASAVLEWHEMDHEPARQHQCVQQVAGTVCQLQENAGLQQAGR